MEMSIVVLLVVIIFALVAIFAIACTYLSEINNELKKLNGKK